MTRLYTLAEIEAMKPCKAGIDWLREHWPRERETWTLPEALRAGCESSHAVWLAARDPRALPTVQNWAGDCAERALPVFEKLHPGDDRPRLAIDAARRCIAEPTEENRKAAVRAARAVRAADAAAAAWAVRAARAAAWAAVRAAADAADADAADAAAAAASDPAAERVWQRHRLAELLEKAQ